jgi:hypothetical protein
MTGENNKIAPHFHLKFEIKKEKLTYHDGKYKSILVNRSGIWRRRNND